MEQAIDIGSGPHCLLARLAVNAGASRVDAIEQNDSFVSHAIGAFGAEAAGETTHAAVTSLRACAGAAALGPLFDITVVDANPPPPSRAAEVQKCAEGAAAAGVEPGAPHSHLLPCHSVSHTNLKSPCVEQAVRSQRRSQKAW